MYCAHWYITVSLEKHVVYVALGKWYRHGSIKLAQK